MMDKIERIAQKIYITSSRVYESHPQSFKPRLLPFSSGINLMDDETAEIELVSGVYDSELVNVDSRSLSRISTRRARSPRE